MTEPYYRDDLATLYFGDCRELLPIAADVAVTDPPYAVRWAPNACTECGNDDPIGAYAVCSDCIEATDSPGHRTTEMLGYLTPNRAGKGAHTRGYADHDPEAFAALLDVAWRGVRASLPPGALLVSFCGNRTFHELVSAAARAGFRALDVLAFLSPPGMAKSTTTLRPGHELAALMRLPGPVRHINPDWTAANTFSLPRPRRAESAHLTTKSLAWMHELVSLLARPDETVLDPFCGSGSTLVAASQLGRRSIGVEIDERSCEIAAQRLSQGSLELGLLT